MSVWSCRIGVLFVYLSHDSQTYVMKNTKRLLLIVDPQIDFISGTLPVPGAVEAMDALAGYVREHDGEWAEKVVTNDWHPVGHCSFQSNGGEWPVHCLQYSEGAAVYRPLLDALYATEGETVFLQKGLAPDHEEYSILQNEISHDMLFMELSPYYEHNITDVDICGLAGDICVLNTLRDMLTTFGKEIRFHLLTAFSPSIDGGQALGAFLDAHPEVKA